jgi:hypothetical protein
MKMTQTAGPKKKLLDENQVIDDVYDYRILSRPDHVLSSLRDQVNLWSLERHN